MITFIQFVQRFNLTILTIGVVVTLISGLLLLKQISKKNQPIGKRTYANESTQSEADLKKATNVFRRMQQK